MNREELIEAVIEAAEDFAAINNGEPEGPHVEDLVLSYEKWNASLERLEMALKTYRNFLQ